MLPQCQPLYRSTSLSLILGIVAAAPPLVRQPEAALLSLWTLLRLVGGPPPFVCLFVGASLLAAVPLLFAPVLCVVSRESVVLPHAPFVLGLPSCYSWACGSPLCGIPRSLFCCLLRRSSSLICYVRCLSRLLCCLLLCCSVGFAFDHARAPGALLCSLCNRPWALSCLLCYHYLPLSRSFRLFPVRCAPSCSDACMVPLWLMPGLVRAPPPAPRATACGRYLPIVVPSLTASLSLAPGLVGALMRLV